MPTPPEPSGHDDHVEMSPPGSTPVGRVVLKRREEGRILKGHRWVFSNEIKQSEENLQPGDVVDVLREDGRPLGAGWYNPHSLIAVRMLGEPGLRLDAELLEKRLRKAWLLRRRLYPDLDAYRVAHGESDDLPGLIVDKYGDVLCVQSLCCGAERSLPLVCDAIESLFSPRAVVERNESHLRSLEGLEMRSGLLRGTAPGEVEIREGDARFLVDPLSGHKTGFYFDQRENRLALRRYAAGARVLDAYCHAGAFGIHAALAGAREVLAVDVAAEAVARARRNAELNDLRDRVDFETGDAAEVMEALRSGGRKFDVVVLDPPSFTRSRKNVPAARRGYIDVNWRALRVLNRGGILATASCSFHITDETFMAAVQEAAVRGGRVLRLLEWRSQAPDHPVLPAMAETRYLKVGIFQVD